VIHKGINLLKSDAFFRDVKFHDRKSLACQSYCAVLAIVKNFIPTLN
jgi:hypothetical protein